MVLRGRWFNTIVLNMQATSVEKSYASKDSSYEELAQVLNHFPKYHMKILLRHVNANWGERIFSN